MRRYLAIPVTILIAAASVRVMCAQAPHARRTAESDRRIVLALERQWLDAHDSTTLDRILADDFRHVLPTGQVIDKVDQVAYVTSHPLHNGHAARLDPVVARTYGDTAVAIGSVVLTDTSGQEVGRNAFLDVFAYRARRWQAVSAQETAMVTGLPRRTRR